MVRRVITRALAVALLPLIPMLMQSAPAYADTLVNQDVPFDGMTTNPCNNDTVELAGTMHMVFHLTFDVNGFHLNSVDNTSNLHSVAPAVPSGANYTANQTDTLILNMSDNGPTVENETDHINIISDGSQPNYYFHVTFHFVLQPGGVPTANVANVSTTCN